MRVEHIAIWTKKLEKMRDFYIRYFGAKAGPMYENVKTGFKSYFLSFDEGCRLEIMQKASISEYDNDDRDMVGFSHFAISVGSKSEVEALTNRMRSEGYRVLSEPRTTGDGYYESVISDPDGNRVEITV